MGEWSYGRLRIQMNKAFDIGVESLSRTGGAETAGLGSRFSRPSGDTIPSDKFDATDTVAAKSFGDTANGGTFFLETFGCQMNDHDSEKVAGVLLSRGGPPGGGPGGGRVVICNIFTS